MRGGDEEGGSREGRMMREKGERENKGIGGRSNGDMGEGEGEGERGEG